MLGLGRSLREAGCEAMLITHAPDIRYLTGFSGDDSWLLLVAKREARAVVVSDRRFEEELQRLCPFARLVMRSGRITEAAADLIEELDLQCVAFQADRLTVAARSALVKRIGAKRLTSAGDWLNDQRSIKDEVEVKAIRGALRIQQKAYRQLLEEIGPGMREQEIAARLNYHMQALGADGPSFNTIVASGPNASLPHAVPGRRKLRRNEGLLIDWGAFAGGYCSDLTRVICFGKMPDRLAEAYRVVSDAQQAAIDAIAPGKTLKEIDAVARGIITDAGYGKEFAHGLGHGLGIEIHEPPALSPRSQGELKAGHVVTVEPGVYLPGVGGVRIEDDVLVTDKGHRKLSRLPTDLKSAIIQPPNRSS